MLTHLAFVFICVRASSTLVPSALLQPVVHWQVYIFEISPLLLANMNRKFDLKIYLNTLIFLFIIYPETPNSSEDEDDNESDGDEGNGQCWR